MSDFSASCCLFSVQSSSGTRHRSRNGPRKAQTRKLPIIVGTVVQVFALAVLFYLPQLGLAGAMIACFTFGVGNAAQSSVVRAATAQATPVTALAVSGMNDVLNSQGFTQAAWLNRIPNAAWTMMLLIAVFSNLLLGSREQSGGVLVPLIVPVVASLAFFLIADIDSPQGGVIRVIPHNLIAVSQTMNTR
jgi:hypothetical protein